YWQTSLAGATPGRLPIDGGLEPIAPFSAAGFEIAFDAALTTALRQLAANMKTTVGLVLLGLYAFLFSRRWSRQDILIPIVTSGRYDADHADVMGFFAHQLPLRLRFTRQETFSGIVSVVSREFLAATGHIESFQCVQLRRLYGELADLLKGACFNWISWE